jgi:NADH dehydrogenase
MDYRKISKKASRVLITGGSGFLGGRLGKALKEKQFEVNMTASSAKPPFLKLNFFEKEWDSTLFAGLDTIIHCAALISGKSEDLDLVNFQGTKRLLLAAERYKVPRFVFISSIDVLLQDSDYSRTKHLAEELVRNSDLDWAIIRPSLIFGPHDHNFSRLKKSINKLPLFPLPNWGSFLWQPVYVDDLIEVICQLLQGKITAKEINVVGPEDLTFRQVVEILESSLGKRKRKIPIPNSLTWLLGKIASLVSIQAEANFKSSFVSKLISDQMGPCIRCETRLVDYYPPCRQPINLN